MNKNVRQLILSENPELIPREILKLEDKIIETTKKHEENKDEIVKEFDRIDEELQKIVDEVKTIELTPGPQGEKGLDGKDGKDGQDGSQGVRGVQGEPGKDGKDGKDGSPDTPEQIAGKLNTLEDAVDAKVIKGLVKVEDVVKELKNPKSKNRLDIKDINNAKLDFSDLRWHGGGITQDDADTRYVNTTGDTMTGNLNFSGAGINTADYVKLNVSATPQSSAPGLIQWNSTDGTYDMGLLNQSVLQVGQETMFYGKASGAIANGDLCQFAGTQGDHILIKKAVGAEIEANPHYLVGVATENIANGSFGYVTWFGKVNDIYTKTPNNQDTADWVAGDILYFNVSTGQMTKTMPSAPDRVITVAAVIKEQTGASETGKIIVRPTLGTKLQDLNDVNGTALTTDGQFPVWHNTEGYFDFDKNINNYALQAIHTDSKEPTGFVNRTSSAWTFTDGTGKFEVTTSSSYDIYFAGVKHTISTTKSINITDVEGPHYIYFDTDDTLKEEVNPTNGTLLTLITQKCLVGIVYWDATNNVGVYVGEERHGIEMDGITHYYLHNTRGLQYVSGLGLGDFVIGDGSLDSHAQFSIATGTVADEDIGLTVDDIASTTGLPILYRDGANGYWRTVTQAGFSCYQNPTGATNRLMYNQLTGGSWTRTEIGEGNYVLYHVFATTGKVKQMYSIMGQNEYTTLPSARLGAQSEISALILGNLPGPEIRPIATVIFQTDKDYGNTINARIVEVDGLGTDDYVDWRTNDLPRGVTASDHGSLTGLTDDDHTQYVLVNGTRAMTGNLTAPKVFTGSATGALFGTIEAETNVVSQYGVVAKVTGGNTSAGYFDNQSTVGNNSGTAGIAQGVGGTNNYGGYFYASGATNNYAIYSLAGTNYFGGSSTFNSDARGKDFVKARSSVVTRDGSGYITQIAKTGGRTIVITRDASNFISSYTDGTNTWTITRDLSNYITAITVT